MSLSKEQVQQIKQEGANARSRRKDDNPYMFESDDPEWIEKYKAWKDGWDAENTKRLGF
jgi:hypothetical protein